MDKSHIEDEIFDGVNEAKGRHRCGIKRELTTNKAEKLLLIGHAVEFVGGEDVTASCARATEEYENLQLQQSWIVPNQDTAES